MADRPKWITRRETGKDRKRGAADEEEWPESKLEKSGVVKMAELHSDSAKRRVEDTQLLGERGLGRGSQREVLQEASGTELGWVEQAASTIC